MNKLEKELLDEEMRIDKSAFTADDKNNEKDEKGLPSDNDAATSTDPEDAGASTGDLLDGGADEDLDDGIQLKMDDAFFKDLGIDTESGQDEMSLDLSSLGTCREEIIEGSESEEDQIAMSFETEKLYNETVHLMRSGEIDLDGGVILLRKTSSDGNAESSLFLGQIYSDRKNEMYNPVLAFESYKSAAEMGHGQGFYNVGLCLSRGFGCEKDDLLACEYFRRGAEMLNPDCICALGMCYEFGVGCEIDYEFALRLYQRGADLNHPISINNLGGCYFYGHGVEQDKSRAVELYERAAELGCSNSQCRLGICYEMGDGCEYDGQKAFECYKSAAKAKNAIALYRLASCYDRGIGTEQNFNQAFKYYFRSASLGYDPARYEAGKMMMSGRGTKKSPDEAYKMFSSAAKNGYAAAEYEVANCFFEGVGAIRNRTSAYRYYLRAYDSQSENRADAAYRLGLCHLKGLGTEQDSGEAFEWFSRGASLGSAEAMYMLGECYFFGIGSATNEKLAASSFIDAAARLEDREDELSSLPALYIALAQCYEYGIGTEKDPARAMSTYKKAADSGDEEALYRTGRAVMQGVGMKAEYAAARHYFLRAARKGYVPAMLTVGILADEGKGISKNRKDARSWYARAVAADNEPKQSLFDFPERFAEGMKLYSEAKIKAEYRLGMLIGDSEKNTQGYIQAYEYIALAAAAGFVPAQNEIAKLHVSGGDLKEYFEGPFFNAESRSDSAEATVEKSDLGIAMNKLGDSFFDGKNFLKKNQVSAARCYRFAAELGNIDAAYSYGWCLRHGAGVRENDGEAVKWLKMAADKGNSNAAYSYGLCCEEGAGTGVKNKREALYYYRSAASSGHSEAAQRYKILSEREEQ